MSHPATILQRHVLGLDSATRVWHPLAVMCQSILVHWLTLFGLLGATLPSSAADSLLSRHPVVLVHGIYDTEWTMRWLTRRLRSRGWDVHGVGLKPNDGSITFEAMARQLEAFVDARFRPGEKFDIVAFSMGGLVSRYYIQKLGGAARVRRFVSISTPNHGTIWAYLSGRAGIRQMRPGSPMLEDLNAGAAALGPLGYTSIYTPLDLTILPAASSRMAVGKNVIVWAPLHPLMMMAPSSLRAVQRALE